MFLKFLKLSPKPQAKSVFPVMFQRLLNLLQNQLSSQSPDKTPNVFYSILCSFPFPNSCLVFLAVSPWHLDTVVGYCYDGQILFYPATQLWKYNVSEIRRNGIIFFPAEHITDLSNGYFKVLECWRIIFKNVMYDICKDYRDYKRNVLERINNDMLPKFLSGY